MTTSQLPLEHPLLAAARAIGEVLDGVAGVDPLYLSTGEKRGLMAELTRSMSRLAAMRAGVLAVADDVAAEEGVRSAGVWLAAQTRTSRREAAHDERVGEALARRWGQVAEAAGEGRVTWEQAEVLVRSLDALPDDLDRELVTKAEAHLVAEAGQFGPRELARLGRRVLEVVAPSVVDVEEARALAAEERRARRATRLSFRPRGDGSTDVHARLPDHVASRLRVYLDAFTSPRRAGSLGDVDHLPLPRAAWRGVLRPPRARPGRRPSGPWRLCHVGDGDADPRDAQTGLRSAETSTGESLSASEVRRLACTAGIIPIVLGGAGEILDLGRSRRLFSSSQRKAMAVRDRHCRAEGCDIPAAWCEAHHAHTPWSRGGRTDLPTACSCAPSTTTEPTTPAGTPRVSPTATSATRVVPES